MCQMAHCINYNLTNMLFNIPLPTIASNSKNWVISTLIKTPTKQSIFVYFWRKWRIFPAYIYIKLRYMTVGYWRVLWRGRLQRRRWNCSDRWNGSSSEKHSLMYSKWKRWELSSDSRKKCQNWKQTWGHSYALSSSIFIDAKYRI